MKWLILNSLKKRYTALIVVLAIMMLAYNWFIQNQINEVKKNIQANIESRNILYQRSRHIRNVIGQFREIIYKFQVDPQQIEDNQHIFSIISQAILSSERLAAHPWIKENYSSTISELTSIVDEFKTIAKNIIQIRLTPAELFPSLKIANITLRPLSASFIENINLAIKDIEDTGSGSRKKEYQLLLELRYQWVQMISDFRMYMLNKLNSFQESFINTQLAQIEQRQNVVGKKLDQLITLNKRGNLGFNTSIAIGEITKLRREWLNNYAQVKYINKSGEWRSDTLLLHNELEPKLDKVSNLLRILDLAIEQHSEKDIKSLSDVAQRQVNSLWVTTILGLFILSIGYIYLLKLVLNPIAAVTHALNNESQGLTTSVPLDVSVLETKNLVTAFSDMRQQIHSRQTELEYHALHDSLTGLANRDLLNERIQQAIHNAQQERSSFAILIMDLDRFKEVNDTLGHSIGDVLLQNVAQRLSAMLRETDVIVRLGGDEFSILLNMSHMADAEKIASKITKEFHEVFVINDISLYVGISIGISLYPEHGVTVQTLMQHADIAMYEAKRNKTGYEIYDSKFDEHSIGKLSLISDIRSAIDSHQLFLKYQPIVNLETGEIVCAEALLRWRHPKFGEVTPDKIIPIAEQTGLINAITYWVIDTAANYLRYLQDKGILIKISVNLSVYNLQEANFVDRIIKTLDKHKIPASSFVMEITESTIMNNPKKSIDILTRLDDLGIEISVDDFGTGYSSLTYLKTLPLSKLKIDKSFIMDMTYDENDAIIVRSTIDLAHNLGMSVIAEGIEEKESMDLLNILGCELGQGFYLSRPIEGDEFEIWYNKNTP